MDNMKNKNKKITNTLKNILLILIPILIILSNRVFAYNIFDLERYFAIIGNSCRPDGEAPWATSANSSGERSVYYPSPVRYQATYDGEEQEIQVFSEAVYCCNLYAQVRSGEFDHETHFIANGENDPIPSQVTGKVEDNIDAMTDDEFNTYMVAKIGAGYYYTRNENSKSDGNRYVSGYTASFQGGATFDASGKGFLVTTASQNEDGSYQVVLDSLDGWMTEIFDSLPSTHLVNSYDAGGDVTDPNVEILEDMGDSRIGPIVCIMERERTADNTYGGYENEGYSSAGSGTWANNAEAYIITAINGLYQQGTGEYTLLDIQYAWWDLVDAGIPGHTLGIPKYASIPAGIPLRNEALAYEVYRKNYLVNDKLRTDSYRIETQDAEAIIDQNEQSYTVGPFRLIYPSGITVKDDDSEKYVSHSFNKFVYVKGLSVKTYENKELTNTLYYDELYNDFEIVYPTGSGGTTGGSGLQKLYPRSNNEFYVKFYSNGKDGYKAVGTPDHAEVTFSLEYLSTMDCDYELLKSNADLYVYIGHTHGNASFDGIDNNNGRSGDNYNFDYPYDSITVTATYHDLSWNSEYWQYNSTGSIYYTEQEFLSAYPSITNADPYHHNGYHYWGPAQTKSFRSNYYYLQPYIKMSNVRLEADIIPQELMRTDKGKRKYIAIFGSGEVDLTMKLGGKVFLDVRQGKETKADGYDSLYDITNGDLQDYGMQDVVVLLYQHRLGNSLGEREEGKLIKWTTTDENGEYSFEDINEMYKYHVEFIYNGQYYEPTKYTLYESFNKSTEEIRQKLKDKGTTDENILKRHSRKIYWEKSSKALESYVDRDTFNKKFEEVGAYPTNVVPDGNGYLQYPSTYRDNLENLKVIDDVKTENQVRKSAGVLVDYDIDEYGNLIAKGKSEYVDFARESLMRAYTYERADDERIEDVTEQNQEKALFGDNHIYEVYGGNKLDIFLYPISEVFVSNDKVRNSHTSVSTKPIKALYEILNDDSVNEMEHINLGLQERDSVEIKVEKDVASIYFEVNGKTHEYKYEKRKVGDLEVGFGLDVRAIDGFARYRQDLTREIYREDYEYDGSLYSFYRNLKTVGEDGTYADMTDAELAELIKAKEQGELEVYVKYKIAVTLYSSTTKVRITEIVDYSDKEFTIVANVDNNNSNIGTKADRVTKEVVTQEEIDKYGPYYGTTMFGSKITEFTDQYAGLTNSSIKINSKSKYADDKQTKGVADPEDDFLGDYNRVYLDTEDVYLTSTNYGFTAYVTYRVNRQVVDGKRKYVFLDEAGDMTAEDAAYIMASKVNIAEINGYKTYYLKKDFAPNIDNGENYAFEEYDENDVAGFIDKWSTPGNLKHVNKEDTFTVKDDNGTSHYVLSQAREVAKEADSDMAPLLHIILNKEHTRTINGNVWEDERKDQGDVSIGDGVFNDGEKIVNGVTVQLVEIRKDNDGKIKEESIVKEYKTGKSQENALEGVIHTGVASDINYSTEEGQYEFRAIAPGDYIVRFIYGGDASSAIGTTAVEYSISQEDDSINNPMFGWDACPNTYNEVIKNTTIYDSSDNKNRNIHSYTGNDYKSTTYQAGVDTNLDQVESGTFAFNFGTNDGNKRISDAMDIWSRRQTVNKYSDKDVTNHKAEVLSSFEKIPCYNTYYYDANEMNKLLKELYENTYMIAESGTIDLNLEYNRSATDEQDRNNIGSGNYDKSGFFEIAGLDFGLERRPKAQLKTSNQVINVKVTLANGNVLFDARDTATNVQWTNHLAHNVDQLNKYTKDINYSGNKMKVPYIRAKNGNGVINLTIDEELMQGARIEITYAVTVANIGEVDYDSKKFYYKGIKEGNVVTTIPEDVVVYVGYQPNTVATEQFSGARNNLFFNKDQNPDWEVIQIADIVKDTANDKDDNLVNRRLLANMKNYNTIIHTKALNKELRPISIASATGVSAEFANDPLNAVKYIRDNVNSVAGVNLTLSTVVSGDTKGVDMTYNNLAEIVKVSNKVGRRLNYSVVGNQDPLEEADEIDADISQEVSILPPFGQTHRYYYLGFGIAAILLVGTLMVMTFTKKKEVPAEVEEKQ